jgi:hypothetical protein
MIRLGTRDRDDIPEDRRQYFRHVHEASMLAKNAFRGEKENEWLSLTRSRNETVTEIQQFLKQAGFFPYGKVDGLCGYRTASSMRLFQEYVRSVEGDTSIGYADGIFGKNSLAHIKRWQNNAVIADWVGFTSDNPSPEHKKWMRLLRKVKAHYRANLTALLKKVEAFPQASDTRKVADWNLNPGHIHLLGVRRAEAQPGERKNDDVFILLLNGLVFKFYGTTDPGKSSHSAGAPFLVHGQHCYRFGWHRISDMKRVYRALKPKDAGVLIIRDSNRDRALTQSDLHGDLERNNSINIHWGGKGVSNWSQGCQVICGKGYINHNNDKVDCSAYAATFYPNLGKKINDVYQSKGAYSVLVDLVTAFSGDLFAVNYMLVYEEDLGLDGGIGPSAAENILARIS